MMKRISRRNKRRLRVWLALSFLFVLLAIVIKCGTMLLGTHSYHTTEVPVKEMLLEPNPYSRPQKKLKSVKGVVIHYTANPGTDAKANRNYFDSLKNNDGVNTKTYASSHYIVGLDGTIVQCIPLNEIAYASNDRNKDTISIECCHPTEDGHFEEATYQSVVRLVAWLCGKYKLSKDDIIRHYDVTGKLCPKYYVENPKKWELFKNDIWDYLTTHSIT